MPDLNEPLRTQEAEKAAEGASGLEPKNAFAPKIVFFPRPRLSGVSLGFMVDVTHPVKWVFSAKYRRACREVKAIAKKVKQHEARKRRGK